MDSTAPLPASPPAWEPTPTSQPEDRYEVRPGDTLSGVAVRFNTTAARPARLNDFSKPNRICIGQQRWVR